MRQVNVHYAKTHLSKLIKHVEDGEEIVIARNGRPVARLVPHAIRRKRTGYGSLRGQLDMTGFHEADEEIIREFGLLD